MLSYGFMQRAFIIAIIIGVIIPLIGVIIVLKRWSSVGDALSHSSLAGIALGLWLGYNPVLSAIFFSIFFAILLEGLRKLFPKYAELAISIVMSLGVGLSAVFSGLLSNTTDFSNFLFGSIVAIQTSEIIGISIVAIFLIIVSLFLYYELFYISFDESAASLDGVPIHIINLLFTILTAVIISLSARTVGALVISSLLTLPVACAMQWARSYRQNLVLSILFSVLFMTAGLTLSYYLDLKPGGTIVLIAVSSLFLNILFSKLYKNFQSAQPNI